MSDINPLSANPIKWSNTLKQFVFDHFVGLPFKGLDHFRPILHFYNPWKRQKTKSLWYFQGI